MGAEHSYEHRALMNDEYLKNTTPLTFSEMGYGQSAAPSARSVTPPPPAPFAGAPASQPQAAGIGGSSIDGKEFFRRARSQLSYEAFNLFLASIKRSIISSSRGRTRLRRHVTYLAQNCKTCTE